jgi:hypothetical protein
MTIENNFITIDKIDTCPAFHLIYRVTTEPSNVNQHPKYLCGLWLCIDKTCRGLEFNLKQDMTEDSGMSQSLKIWGGGK